MMTYSLKLLLLCAAIVASAIGLLAKRYIEIGDSDHTRVPFLTTIQGSLYSWDAWCRHGYLRYGVARPSGVSSPNWRVGVGTEPVPIFLRPDGIYLHGQPMRMTARVYVYRADGTFEPIELTEEQLREIGIKPNTESKAWEEKVEPVIDAEYQIGRARLDADP